MRLIIALVTLLLAPISSGHAQSRDTRAWDTRAWDSKAANKKIEAPAARPKDRAGGMKACTEYGAGFYRLAGSDTCIRIGGGIGSDVGTSGMR